MIENMEGNGKFGFWFEDKFGLPAYSYTCNQYVEEYAKTPTTYGYSIDHFHQIGNDRITATAHNGGYIQVLESSRGFQYLTYMNKKKEKLGGGIAYFQIDNENEYQSDLYEIPLTNKEFNFQRIFGMGYFQKKFNKEEIEFEHNICTPFSDDPVLISEIMLSNKSKANSSKNIKLIDFWDIYLHHILRSLMVTSNNRKKFGKNKLLNVIGKLIKFSQKLTGTDTDGARLRFDKKFSYDIVINSESQTIIIQPKYKKKVPAKIDEPAKHNYYPKTIFLSMIEGSASSYFYNHSQIFKKNIIKFKWDKTAYSKGIISIQNLENPCAGIGTEFTLKSGDTKRLICVFGYAELGEIDNLINKYKNICEHTSILEWNAKNWRNSLIDLQLDKDPWLSRETKWHSYYTRSACYFDEYFNYHKFPQGSIYLFGHCLDGAIRDYMLFLNAVIFMDPKLAKEYLSYAISFMEPNGKLPYGIYGFAKTFTRSIHSKPSDLYIFLIWGILEYLYITRDFDYLEQKISFYPKSLKKESTVLEKLYVSLDYLFSDKVGIGEHGLIKCNDGDWSDGISLMVKNRKKFINYGESNFNTAFTIYIIQKLIPLLEKYNSELASQCSEKLIKLKLAILQSWNGRWFYRGWDGQGKPIGDKNIYLEHHNWILISKLLEKEQAQSLINEIYKNLDNPSPIGQYISYPSEKTPLNILPPGWDVNGGVWHAMNSLLTWGYSLYDADKAYNSLIKNSMARRAEAYPHLWYGIWTGPDAYIANYAENAGQAFYHLLTPMCDYPAMNLNAHACYLLSVIKMAGIEAYYDAIEIDPKFVNQNFEFKSPLITMISKANHFSIDFSPIKGVQLDIRIKKPNWWNSGSVILVNNVNYTEENKELLVINDKITIKVRQNMEKINIILKSQ
jgi:cellobiose phosphorylase